MKQLSKMVSGLMLIGLFAFTPNVPMKHSKSEIEIQEVLVNFVKAGEKRKISAFQELLHSDFRVIANRYPSPEKTTVMTAATYLDLMQKGVIGEVSYKVEFKNIEVVQHSATAICLLKSEKQSQFVTFLLVKNQKDKWQIISDLAVLAQ